MARLAVSCFEHSRSLPDASAQRSLKWQLLAAEELARPGLMRLQALRRGDVTVDFAWDVVDVRAGRMLQHPVGELVGRRLLEVLAGQHGHRSIFEHYRRVFESGVAEAALQLHIDHGREDMVRHAALRLGDGIAVTLQNVSAARRAQAVHSALSSSSQAASATVGPDSSKPTTTRA